MRNRIRFGLAAAAAVALGLTVHIPATAQHDHGGGGMSMPSRPLPEVRTGKLKGTFVSRDETSINIETKRSNQTVTIAYMIDGKTTFIGDPRPGTEVTVKYEERAGMQKAIAVEAKKVKDKHSH